MARSLKATCHARMLNIVQCTKLRYYNLTSQKGDKFYSVVIIRGILIDNLFLH